ncbi:hypothetical protein BC834DRAFT_414191 [Gloeopeniophorella convolvens]|nr:hypothetical protein BC834DRAFT_414191 [Gloeopeniophorella convolvens]
MTGDNPSVHAESQLPNPDPGDVEAQGLRELESEASGPSRLAGDRNSSDHSAQDEVPKERKPNDYGDNANALWSLYSQEAENHDKALIETWRSDMEAIIIFAGLYSATLTSFLVDSYKNLQPDPTKETAYFGQQSAISLARISQQLSLNDSRASVAPTTFVPLPSFHPSPSDVRVNVYWFMSLVFSLSAALFATIIQQWVRNYMQVFQRYDHSLKRARLRQYLFQGTELSRMSVVVEMVPALIHISLFLFFMGIADFLFNLNITTAITTTIPIFLCTSLYIWSVVAPVIAPQLPFQTPFSSLAWYIFQKLGGRTYRSHDGPHEKRKRVSTSMTEGRMQLAMDETEGRRLRDAQAIQWLIQNRSEESEVESLVMDIPGSFDAVWGIQVWQRVSELGDRDRGATGGFQRATLSFDGQQSSTLTARHQPSPSYPARLLRILGRPVQQLVILRVSRDSVNTAGVELSSTGRHSAFAKDALIPSLSAVQEQGPVRDLCGRVAQLLETCGYPSRFPNEEAQRRRARACIETTASLKICINAPLRWFGETDAICQMLTYLGSVEKVQDSLEKPGRDAVFAMRWTSMTLLVTRELLQGQRAQQAAKDALSGFTCLYGAEGDPRIQAALESSRRIDEQLIMARECVEEIWGAVDAWNPNTNPNRQIKDVLQDHEPQIDELERIKLEGQRIHLHADPTIFTLVNTINEVTHGVLEYLPDATFKPPATSNFSLLGQDLGTPSPEQSLGMLQLLRPGRLMQKLGVLGPELRKLISPQYSEGIMLLKIIREDLKNLDRHLQWQQLAERQIWRLQDIADGGLAFHVELFLLALKRLLPRFSAQDPHRLFYILTFRSVTSDWERCKHSLGTQYILLSVACDMVFEGRGMFSFPYPDWIVNELLTLLDNVIRGQTGAHVESAAQELRDLTTRRAVHEGLRRKFSRVIRGAERSPDT